MVLTLCVQQRSLHQSEAEAETEQQVFQSRTLETASASRSTYVISAQAARAAERPCEHELYQHSTGGTKCMKPRPPDTCHLPDRNRKRTSPRALCEYWHKYCMCYQHGVPAVLGATVQYYWITHVGSVFNQSACSWRMILVPSVARWSRDEHTRSAQWKVAGLIPARESGSRQEGQCRAPPRGRVYVAEGFHSDDFIVEI